MRVGKGTLYRYFLRKEDLFLAAVDWVMRQLHEQVDLAMAGVEDPIDRIRRAVGAHLAFFTEHSRYVELLIQERALFKDRRQSTYFLHRDAYADHWRELYRGLIAAGRVRPLPIEQIRAVITDLLYGIMFTNYFTGRRQDPAEQAQDVLDIFFHGILSDRTEADGAQRCRLIDRRRLRHWQSQWHPTALAKPVAPGGTGKGSGTWRLRHWQSQWHLAALAKPVAPGVDARRALPTFVSIGVCIHRGDTSYKPGGCGRPVLQAVLLGLGLTIGGCGGPPPNP